MSDQMTFSDRVQDNLIANVSLLDVLRHRGDAWLECKGDDGRVKWRDLLHNALTEQGRAYVMGTAFGSVTKVGTFYYRLLLQGAVPGLSSTLASKGGTELVASGYAARATTPTTVNGTTTFSAGTWTAGAVWPTLTYMFLATSADDTGLMMSYMALSQPRTLGLGDALNVIYAMSQN